jgi:hypothetical protein
MNGIHRSQLAVPRATFCRIVAFTTAYPDNRNPAHSIAFAEPLAAARRHDPQLQLQRYPMPLHRPHSVRVGLGRLRTFVGVGNKS